MRRLFVTAVTALLIGSAITAYADTQRPVPADLWEKPAPVVESVDLDVLRAEMGIEVEQVGPREEDVDLLARLIYWEAGNQDSYGKRLVADVVLNRVADQSGTFPDTLEEVIFQKGQFAVAGCLYDAEIPAECYEIAREEMIDQVDWSVLWFNCGGYLPYGEPAYQYGDHYFSK